MGIRSAVGSKLESTIGRERTNTIRKAERNVRNSLARKLQMQPAKQTRPKPATSSPANGHPAVKRSRWSPADPLVPHPKPTMGRHALLRALHEKTQPRTYVEIGISRGGSLRLSRTRSIGVDPAFRIEQELHCDVQLVKATSDDFFARDDALAHFGGVPVDLAFIDGLHLSEFALRDFINIERLMADTGVVVFDDVLPRNALEAARDRKTAVWTGDVYKAVEVLRRRRPDLVVFLVNTAPTGTAVVVNVDQASTVLRDAYDEDLEYLLAPDPQEPPHEYLDRSIAVEADVLMASPVWDQLAAYRESAAPAELATLWDELRKLQPR
jgi:hypothetical protein